MCAASALALGKGQIMGAEKNTMIIEGCCDWCEERYTKENIRYSRYPANTGGRKADFCSDECYALWYKQDRLNSEERVRQYINQRYVGGYDEYMKSQCFICGRKCSLDHPGTCIHHHHIYYEPPLLVKLCQRCHTGRGIGVHSHYETGDKLIDLVYERYGVEIDASRMAGRSSIVSSERVENE